MKTTTLALAALTSCLFAAGCGNKAEPEKPEHATTANDTHGTDTDAVEIETEEVTYTAGDTTLKGYLAYPKGATGTAGVLVVHEWWGHNAYARSRAEMLAKMGYTALAVDMYGDGKNTEHPADAKKFATEVMSNMDVGVARFEAAMKLVREHPTTDPEKISAIGYCFGGGVVLHMARMGMDLDVVGSFHGSLATKSPAAEGAVKAKLFVAHGAADAFITAEQVEAFKKEMADARADLEFVAYEGATHSFTNPAATEIGKANGLPVEYNEKADKASWKRFSEILAETYR